MANSQHSPMYKACVRSLLRTHTQSAPSTFRAYSVQMPFPGKYILHSEAWHATYLQVGRTRIFTNTYSLTCKPHFHAHARL